MWSETNCTQFESIETLDVTSDENFDYGDAPSGYPQGAQHYLIEGSYLGLRVDDEPAPQPDGNAQGDDTNGTPNDEDGIMLTSTLAKGEQATVFVLTSEAGYLEGWIDLVVTSVARLRR